jgi:hypothetical protein
MAHGLCAAGDGVPGLQQPCRKLVLQDTSTVTRLSPQSIASWYGRLSSLGFLLAPSLSALQQSILSFVSSCLPSDPT